MNVDAFSAFFDKIKTSVPVVQEFIRGWPPDEQEPLFPYLSALIRKSTLETYNGGPNKLKVENGTVTYGAGEWHTMIDLHFFYNVQSEAEQAIVQISQLFNSDLKRGTRGSFDLSFGPESWQVAYFKLEDFDQITTEGDQRQGERRYVFNVFAESPSIQTIKQQVIKKTVLDAKIGERVRP